VNSITGSYVIGFLLLAATALVALVVLEMMRRSTQTAVVAAT
jgi:hypothetical protein